MAIPVSCDTEQNRTEYNVNISICLIVCWVNNECNRVVYTLKFKDNVQYAVHIWLAEHAWLFSSLENVGRNCLSKSVCECPSTPVPPARCICILVLMFLFMS